MSQVNRVARTAAMRLTNLPNSVMWQFAQRDPRAAAQLATASRSTRASTAPYLARLGRTRGTGSTWMLRTYSKMAKNIMSDVKKVEAARLLGAGAAAQELDRLGYKKENWRTLVPGDYVTATPQFPQKWFGNGVYVMWNNRDKEWWVGMTGKRLHQYQTGETLQYMAHATIDFDRRSSPKRYSRRVKDEPASFAVLLEALQVEWTRAFGRT